ncbi:MAG: hypothetical protein WCF57_06325 [Pyrinomonadaceae bacterium]
MRRHKRGVALLFIGLILVVATTMAALREQDRNVSSSDKQQKTDKKDFENQFPIADFNSPALADPMERAKRQAKGEKYNESISPIDERTDTIFSTVDWEVGISAIPVSQSDAIVVVRVLDAQAHLSNDETGVYSEFTLAIEQLLKTDSRSPLNPDSSIVVERKGGRVRYPSGHLTLYHIRGQGMPRTGHRYVLFLKRDSQEQDFSILTGYELNAGRVALLDSPGDHPITRQKGKDETSFLNELRTAIADPQQ